MALTPIPMVSPLPAPPIRGTDTGAVFSNKTAAFLDAMHDDFQPELNTTATAINALLPTIEDAVDAADEAEAARDLAQGYAQDASDEADIATTQAGIATTQAGLADTARIDAETAEQGAIDAMNAAIGAGPLPAQAGFAGRYLRTDGTTPTWENIQWRLIAELTSNETVWGFEDIPQDMSDLLITFRGTGSASSSITLGVSSTTISAFTSPTSMWNIGTTLAARSMFIPGYNKNEGIVIYGANNNGSGESTSSSGVGIIGWKLNSGGMKHILLNLSTGTVTGAVVRLYGR